MWGNQVQLSEESQLMSLFVEEFLRAWSILRPSYFLFFKHLFKYIFQSYFLIQFEKSESPGASRNREAAAPTWAAARAAGSLANV